MDFSPPKPKNIPTTAQWDEKQNLWLFGRSQKNKYHGKWKFYDKDGLLILDASYVDGKLNGDVTYVKSSHAISLFPRVYNYKIVRAINKYHDGKLLMESYFMPDGQKVNAHGVALPSEVPLEAWWSDGKWVLGEWIKDLQCGKWFWWRLDGSFLAEAYYNDQGELHGSIKRYHNNGELFQKGQYEKGKQEGLHLFFRSTAYTEETYFADYNSKIWKKEVDYRKDKVVAERFFYQNGGACNSGGYPVINADSSMCFDGDVGQFLNERFESHLSAIFEKQGTVLIPDLERIYMQVFGGAIPPELKKYWSIIAKFDTPALFKWTELAIADFKRLSEWITDGENIFECAVLEMQSTFPYEYIWDWFTATVPLTLPVINRMGEHYSYSYHLDITQPHNGAVYLHSHMNYNHWGTSFGPKFAASMDAFLYMMSLFSAYMEYETITEETFLQKVPSLYNQLKIPYYFFEELSLKNGAVAERDFHCTMLPNDRVKQMVRINRWIIELLRGEADVYDIKNYLKKNEFSLKYYALNKFVLDKYEIENIPIFLNLLWATFWLEGFENELDECISSGLKWPSRIVVDACRLVNQLRTNRKALGILTDIPYIKAQLNS